MKKILAKALFLIFFGIFLTGCGVIEKYTESEVVLDGKYKLEDMDNVTFSFQNKKDLIVRQMGIYTFDNNTDGEAVIRICLDDISRELPEDYNYTEYIIQKDGLYTKLIYTSEEFDLEESPMLLVPIEGTDGLVSGDYFNGAYQIGAESNNYLYKFQKDGTVVMQIEQGYYADNKKITLSDHAGSTDYLYEINEDNLVLKTLEGERMMELIPQK